MPPPGYFQGPDLAAQKAMWAAAEAAPKDARGVAIDVRDSEEDGASQPEAGAKPVEGKMERLGPQEKLRQLLKDLREDELALAYDEMQITSLQESMKANNRLQLTDHLRGFENDKLMRLQRAAGYRRQITELKKQMESGGVAQYVAA